MRKTGGKDVNKSTKLICLNLKTMRQRPRRSLVSFIKEYKQFTENMVSRDKRQGGKDEERLKLSFLFFGDTRCVHDTENQEKNQQPCLNQVISKKCMLFSL